MNYSNYSMIILRFMVYRKLSSSLKRWINGVTMYLEKPTKLNASFREFAGIVEKIFTVPQTAKILKLSNP